MLRLINYPIWDQLRLEEALVRTDTRNWCILNSGSPTAIVMGISGKVDELLDLPRLRERPLPVLRRFSGGGTVVVDHNTLFATLICQHSALNITPYPEPIMRWTEQLYAPLLPVGMFALRENDYVLGDRKFGGNAQYLRKERWLHHSTLLWDYDLDAMNYLHKPAKRPVYRQDRDHDSFLCSLNAYLQCPQQFLDGVIQRLEGYFSLCHTSLDQVEHVLQRPHRRSLSLLSVEDLGKQREKR